MDQRILPIQLDIGWKTHFQMKRGCTRLTIKKDVVIGLALQKGQSTFGYLGRDLNSNRQVILFFADGNEWHGKVEDRE